MKNKVRKELQKDLDDLNPFFDKVCDGVRYRLATE